ncbi:MAG: DUF3179 domain-containing (seleno)protein [bacterium]
MHVKTKFGKKILKKASGFLIKKVGLVFAIIVALGFLAYSYSASSNNKSKDNSTSNSQSTNGFNIAGKSITFTDINNNKYELATLKGKKNIILYYYKTDCPVCADEINLINRNISDITNIFPVYILQDSVEYVKSFAAKIEDKSSVFVSDTQLSLYQSIGVDPALSNPITLYFNKNQDLVNSSFAYSTDEEITSNINLLTKNYLTTTKDIVKISGGYIFGIEPAKLQNSCILSDPNMKFTSNPWDINVDNLKISLNKDDFAGCIDKIYPKYTKIQDQNWIKDQDEVYYVEFNGAVYVYPKNILIQHPYLEDYYGYLPVGIVYDGLTDTINVFSRLIDNSEKKFVISGRAYNNHLTLFDITNFSLWNGKIAIGGSLNGYRLLQIPVRKTIFTNVASIRDANVFTKPTIIIDYSVDGLAEYRKNNVIVFQLNKNATQYPIKEEVIKIDNDIISVKDIKFPQEGKTSFGTPYLITKDPYGGIVVYNRKIKDTVYQFTQSNEIINEMPENVNSAKKITYSSSKWSSTYICTEGKLKGSVLQEIAVDRGYYFYLSQ